jgi:hypothetical protein
MRWSWLSIGAVVGIGVAALVGAVVLGKALAGGNEPTTAAEYQAKVVLARDRIDFALERIGKSQSPEELVSRIEEASVIVRGAEEELADADPPSRLTSEAEKLVRTMGALSDELAGTAATLEDPTFEGVFRGLNSLSFQQWVALNAVLAELRSKGIQVEQLARH